MKLLQPAWLLLLVPIFFFFQIWKIPVRTVRGIRICIIVLILLSLCGVVVLKHKKVGNIVIVVDRSRSMPTGSEERIKEMIQYIQKTKPAGNNLSVISFGETAQVEITGETSVFTKFQRQIGQDGSNLAEALEKAVSLIPSGMPGRILVFSDGLWTGRDPINVALLAAKENIPVDYRHMHRVYEYDIAIEKIDTPETVTPGESFLVISWIRSPVPQVVKFKLFRESIVIEEGEKEIPAGTSRLIFRDRIEKPGNFRYLLTITGTTKDDVPENNTAEHIIACKGSKPVLLLSQKKYSKFGEILKRSGIEIHQVEPSSFEWSFENLSDLLAIVVEDLPAEKLGFHAMKNIAVWVKEAGGGFMLTGGKNSFGVGGYFRSPLESILPVSMELRNEHRKLSVSIVVVLDRSGSMMAEVDKGLTKMHLANAAAAQVLDLMTAYDEFGVIAVDSQPHVVVDIHKVGTIPNVRQKILSIESAGGGIFVYSGLVTAFKMLEKATNQNRHIILFADAADAEEPGEYQKLLEFGLKNNITVSVIGLGSETDCDAEFLKDVAARGDGRIFFTQNVFELPRLFAQDTAIVAKNAFIKERTPVKSMPGMLTLFGREFNYNGTIGGYNLCYIKPEAYLGMITSDEYNAPIIAAWNVGVGRALCYCGEVDGEFTGEIGTWQELADLFSSMVRWISGSMDEMLSDISVTQKVENGLCRVYVHLDPEREKDPFSSLPLLKTLKSVGVSEPTVATITMSWVSHDTLSAEIPMKNNETILNVLTLNERRSIALPPICLSYSPEFVTQDENKGLSTLEQIARLTNGKERINLVEIWKDLPKKISYFDITPFLLFFAVILILLEVAERRLGVLSRFSFIKRKKAYETIRQYEIQDLAPIGKPNQKLQPAFKEVEIKLEKTPEKIPEKSEEKSGLISALHKAQKHAEQRLEK